MLPRDIGHEERSVKLACRVAERWRVPNDCRALADVVAREHGHIHRSGELKAAAVMRLLQRCDAIRQPERFAQVLQACEADARGRLGLQNTGYPQAQRLWRALQAALAVPTADIAARATREGLQGAEIGQKIESARLLAVQAKPPPAAPVPARFETGPASECCGCASGRRASARPRC